VNRRGDALPPHDRRLQAPSKWVATYERRLRVGVMAEIRRALLAEVRPVLKQLEREEREALAAKKRGDQSDKAARILAALTRAAIRVRAAAIHVLDIGTAVAANATNGARLATQRALNGAPSPLTPAQAAHNRALGLEVPSASTVAIRAIDIGATEAQRAALSAWSAEQSALVSSIPRESLSALSRLVAEHVREGTEVRTIAKMIEERFAIDDRRAALIARTEVAKLNSRVAQDAMQRAGATEFVWRNVQDERVRGNPNGLYPNPTKTGRIVEDHWTLEGQTFRFDDPPVVDEANGIRALPGTRPNCRCIAVPVFPEPDEAELDAAIAAGEDEPLPF